MKSIKIEIVFLVATLLIGFAANANPVYGNGSDILLSPAIYPGSDPYVLSVHRSNPTPYPIPTSAASVDYIVEFSESVTGVDTKDFTLKTTGVTGAFVSEVSGSDDIYTVTVNTGSGYGTIRLNVKDNDSIKDLSNNPLGGSGLGNGNFTSGDVYDVYDATLHKSRSNPAADGWILESSENSNKGETVNKTSTLLFVGDSVNNKQYRSFLSFNTSGLPDDAVVGKAQLKIKVLGFGGENMFVPAMTHGNLLLDIRQPYFGGGVGLAKNDFQAVATQHDVGALKSVTGAGWYNVTLYGDAFSLINLTGTTQFRLRFKIDDNNDSGADYIKIYSGDADSSNRPQLIVEYYVP